MEEAPAALPAWTASLVRAGYRSQLIAALRPGDGRALMRAAGISAVSAAVRRRHALTPTNHAPGPSRTRTAPAGPQRVSDRGQRNEELDDRVVFVELMTSRASGRAPQWPAAIAPPSKATAGNAPRATVPAPDVARGRSANTALDQRRDSGDSETIEHRRSSRQTSDSSSLPRRQATRLAAKLRKLPSASFGESARRARPDSHDLQAAHGTPRAIEPAVDAPHTFASPWQLPDGAPTAAGGLMFLLPVLERVGFAKWAAERGPESQQPDVLAAQILHLLLSRLRVDEDDLTWTLAAPFRLKPEATQAGQCGKPSTVPNRDLRGFRLQAEGCEVAEYLAHDLPPLSAPPRAHRTRVAGPSAGAPGHHAHTRRRLLPAERSRRADPARRARHRSRMGPVVRSSRGVPLRRSTVELTAPRVAASSSLGALAFAALSPAGPAPDSGAGGAVARRAARGARAVARRPPGGVCRLAEGPASRGSTARRARGGDWPDPRGNTGGRLELRGRDRCDGGPRARMAADAGRRHPPAGRTGRQPGRALRRPGAARRRSPPAPRARSDCCRRTTKHAPCPSAR